MNLGECSSTLANVLSTVLNILSTVKNVLSMVCLWFVGAYVFGTLYCSELTELCGHVALWDKKCPLWGKERPFRERHLKNVRGRTGYIEVQLLLIPTTISIATLLLLLLLLLQLSSPLVWFFGRRGYLEAKSFQDWNKGIFIRSLIVSITISESDWVFAPSFKIPNFCASFFRSKVRICFSQSLPSGLFSQGHVTKIHCLWPASLKASPFTLSPRLEHLFSCHRSRSTCGWVEPTRSAAEVVEEMSYTKTLNWKKMIRIQTSTLQSLRMDGRILKDFCFQVLFFFRLQLLQFGENSKRYLRSPWFFQRNWGRLSNEGGTVPPNKNPRNEKRFSSWIW